MHFQSFGLVQSSYLAGTRAHEVPASTAQEVTRIYLHSTALNRLEWHGAELPFERYQTGSICKGSWQGIPKNNGSWQSSHKLTICSSELPFLVLGLLFFEGGYILLYCGTPTFWQRGLWDSCFQNPSESSAWEEAVFEVVTRSWDMSEFLRVNWPGSRWGLC